MSLAKLIYSAGQGLNTKSILLKLNKRQKGLHLETKNTENHENRRLGLIESLHLQHCSLRGCILPLS